MLRGLLLPIILTMAAGVSATAADAPLALEAKIPLGEVSGRIDHLAVDVPRQRLLVAELGNNSLGVVDLAARGTLRTLGGLNEPQGVGYEPSTDTVYVANAGDGAVRIFKGDDFSPLGRVELGDGTLTTCGSTGHASKCWWVTAREQSPLSIPPRGRRGRSIVCALIPKDFRSTQRTPSSSSMSLTRGKSASSTCKMRRRGQQPRRGYAAISRWRLMPRGSACWWYSATRRR
jgi:hypothetical protein